MSSAKRALRAAREQLAAKNYAEAIAECKAAVQADPTCFEAYVYIGKAAFLMGDHDKVGLLFFVEGGACFGRLATARVGRPDLDRNSGSADA
jgi:hypothetical protein